MHQGAVTALVAEDEAQLRDELCETLQMLWPTLQLVARVGDGASAIEAWQRLQPTFVFLDIHMPGESGLDVARVVSGRSHVIFVTAFDQYAVQAFEQGAADYVLKPFSLQRLQLTVQRLQARLNTTPIPIHDLLRALADRNVTKPSYLRWITASLGQDLRLITSEEIAYFRAEHKYTVVATTDKEAIISTPIKELVDALDPNDFWQIHRGTIVNMRQIAGIRRDLRGRLLVQLKHRKELLPVSARYAHLFRQM
jgi:DNA-binding LytR/AlgR family response regulator